MNELTVAAAVGNLEQLTVFVDDHLPLDCPIKARTQIAVAVEELFVNIAHYAYHSEIGFATVRVDVSPEPVAVKITFRDNGAPFDPLAAQDPDVTLSAEERSIGGLGIFMVKKIMDEISYEYRNGQNILTVTKKL